jgi:poly(A) polymerase
MERQELDSILMSEDVEARLRASWGEIAEAIPELGALAMEDGAGRHKDNVEHTILVTARCPARLRVRLVGLFHDVGKPPTRVLEDDGTVTFYFHEREGEKITKDVLTRLGYPKDIVGGVSRLVGLSGTTKASELWSDSAVRRFVKNTGSLLDDLFDFVAVDVTSRHLWKHEAVAQEVAGLRAHVVAVAALDERRAWRPVVSGDEIMAHYKLGPGKAVGQGIRELSGAQKAAEAKGDDFTQEQAWALLDNVFSVG